MKFRFLLTRRFASRRWRGRRAQAICDALDCVLHEVLALSTYPHAALTTVEAALVALKANATHCGPVARKVEHLLKRRGVIGVEFHSLGSHYVVRDRATGLLHDLECYAGARDQTELPLYRRRGLLELSQGAAVAWLVQRKNAILAPAEISDGTRACNLAPS